MLLIAFLSWASSSRAPTLEAYWGCGSPSLFASVGLLAKWAQNGEDQGVFIVFAHEGIQYLDTSHLYKEPPRDLVPSLPRLGQKNEVKSVKTLSLPSPTNRDAASWTLEKQASPMTHTAPWSNPICLKIL